MYSGAKRERKVVMKFSTHVLRVVLAFRNGESTAQIARRTGIDRATVHHLLGLASELPENLEERRRA